MPSIYDLWAEKYHTTLDTIQSRSAEVDEEMKCTYGELMSRIRKETKTVIKAVQDGGFTKESVSKALSLPEAAGEKEWKDKLEALLHFVTDEIYPRLERTGEEMDIPWMPWTDGMWNPGLPALPMPAASAFFLRDGISTAWIQELCLHLQAGSWA